MESTQNESILDTIKKGELPTWPVSLSIEPATLISIAAIVLIGVSIFLLIKFKAR